MLAVALAALALIDDPTATAVAPPIEAADTDSRVPDDDIRTAAAIVARRTAGQPVGTNRAADKIVLLGRGPEGQPGVLGMMLVTPKQAPPTGDPEVLAIVRTQSVRDKTVPGPTPADLAFVAAHGIPLYIVGEWARPAPVWEVVRVDGAVRYRPIGEVGEIGPWQE